MTDHLERCVGSRNVPLIYIIRNDVEVPPICPPLAQGKPHSLEHGSVKMDMIARCSHDHPTYPADNEAVYHKV